MHLADTYIVAGTQLRIKCYANATREKRDRRADKTFRAIMAPHPPTPGLKLLIHFCVFPFIQH